MVRVAQVARELPAQVRVVRHKFLDEVAHPVAFSQASTKDPWADGWCAPVNKEARALASVTPGMG
ncbi:hypothetical protein VCH24_01140 [Variovorax boronicumulans]|nr:hypothetical protein VCH24_01140 [Variovorax boronicumulans]